MVPQFVTNNFPFPKGFPSCQEHHIQIDLDVLKYLTILLYYSFQKGWWHNVVFCVIVKWIIQYDQQKIFTI